MSHQTEEQLKDALTRMEATALPVYQGSDISQLIRRLLDRQEEVQRQLRSVVGEMDQVAVLLREQADQPNAQATEARNHIALDFADGARLIEEARSVLVQATEHLEYLRYRLL